MIFIILIPYNHMFVHMRSKEFIKQGEEVIVYVPNTKTNEYFFEGVNVKELPSQDIVKRLENHDVLFELIPKFETQSALIRVINQFKKNNQL